MKQKSKVWHMRSIYITLPVRTLWCGYILFHVLYYCGAMRPESEGKVQWRAARWIGTTWDPQSMKWSKSYERIHDELHWPTFQLRRQFLICCQVYKIIHKLDCIDFNDYLNFTRASCTRSHYLTLFCRQSRINAFRYSFFVNCPFLWNELPHAVANAQSFQSFKFKLRNFLY